MVGVRHAHPAGCLKGIGIHHVCHITVVGQEVPVFGLVHAKELALCVELELVGFLVVVEPAGVASAAYASCACIVGILTLAVEGEMAVDPCVFVFDGSPVLRMDG